MNSISLAKALSASTYPGRGIVVGQTPDARFAVMAYFIMGRSENSRNRIFVRDGEGIRTQAFDPSKMTDPSLIIYAPVRVLGPDTIVTIRPIRSMKDSARALPLNSPCAAAPSNRTDPTIRRASPPWCGWTADASVMPCRS